jgi:hypothetical protein
MMKELICDYPFLIANTSIVNRKTLEPGNYNTGESKSTQGILHNGQSGDELLG